MQLKWVKARDGALLGVCKGVARALDVPIGLMRFLWILAVLFCGVGVGLYILLAISLPSEGKESEALKPLFLGVCAKIAQRSNLEVGIVRFLCLCLFLLSLGSTLVGYLVLYFVFDGKNPSHYSDNRPASPPSST